LKIGLKKLKSETTMIEISTMPEKKLAIIYAFLFKKFFM
jgi:hypothetical protein